MRKDVQYPPPPPQLAQLRLASVLWLPACFSAVHHASSPLQHRLFHGPLPFAFVVYRDPNSEILSSINAMATSMFLCNPLTYHLLYTMLAAYCSTGCFMVHCPLHSWCIGGFSGIQILSFCLWLAPLAHSISIIIQCSSRSANHTHQWHSRYYSFSLVECS